MQSHILPHQPKKIMVRLKARRTFRFLSLWSVTGALTYFAFPNEFPVGLFYVVGTFSLSLWIHFMRNESPVEVVESEYLGKPPVIHWA